MRRATRPTSASKPSRFHRCGQWLAAGALLALAACAPSGSAETADASTNSRTQNRLENPDAPASWFQFRPAVSRIVEASTTRLLLQENDALVSLDPAGAAQWSMAYVHNDPGFAFSSVVTTPSSATKFFAVGDGTAGVATAEWLEQMGARTEADRTSEPFWFKGAGVTAMGDAVLLRQTLDHTKSFVVEVRRVPVQGAATTLFKHAQIDAAVVTADDSLLVSFFFERPETFLGQTVGTAEAPTGTVVAKVHQDGSLVWAKTFPGVLFQAETMKAAADGSLIGVFGSLSAGKFTGADGVDSAVPSGMPVPVLLALSDAGDVLWARSHPVGHRAERSFAVSATGEVAAAASSCGLGIVRRDAAGAELALDEGLAPLDDCRTRITELAYGPTGLLVAGWTEQAPLTVAGTVHAPSVTDGAKPFLLQLAR